MILPVGMPPTPPRWASELLQAPPPLANGTAIERTRIHGRALEVDVVGRRGLTLVGVRLEDAVGLSVTELRRAVCESYRRVREVLSSSDASHPIRLWNFVPGILQPMDRELNRYQVFNAGRHDSFCEWFGDPSRFAPGMPTATGVGHEGRDLLVFCLSSAQPGRPYENPRQRSAYSYSRRYGPLPPCFSRAMRVEIGEPDGRLLIGGTASVRGEETVNPGSLEHQLEETFLNMEELVATAAAENVRDVRRCFLEMRSYHVHPEHASRIRTAILSRFPHVRRLESMQADICRGDLLVEIEAVAVVGENGKCPASP